MSAESLSAIPAAPATDPWLARLDRERDAIARAFAIARPFRHVTIEDFLPGTLAERALLAVPPLDNAQFSIARLLEARSYTSDVAQFDPVFREVFDALAAPPFVAWLRALSGIDDLEMDRDLVGGGVHQGARGSRLHVHADHNTHPHDASRYRRVNVLVYLNRDWQAEWGGDLELYDERGSRAVSRVSPAFNRALVMEVHDRAFHGYRPLRVPAGETRKMLAAYYYSRSPHWLQRTEQHGTTFARSDTRSPAEAALIRMRHALVRRLPGLAGLVPKAALPGGDVGQGLVEARERRIPVDLE